MGKIYSASFGYSLANKAKAEGFLVDLLMIASSHILRLLFDHYLNKDYFCSLLFERPISF